MEQCDILVLLDISSSKSTKEHLVYSSWALESSTELIHTNPVLRDYLQNCIDGDRMLVNNNLHLNIF